MVEEYCRCTIYQAGAAERTFSEAGARRHEARRRTFSAHHLRLEIELDEVAGTVRGTATHTLSPLNDGLEAVELDAVELAVSAVRCNGAPVQFSTGTGGLRAVLPRTLSPGERFELAVDYSARPRKGLFFIRPDEGYPDKPYQVWSQGEMEDNRWWFPCYDAPNDRMTSEVLVTVNGRFQAVSNGRLVGVKEHPGHGRKTYHWLHEVPHPTYLVALVVAEFDTAEEVVDGVPLQYYVPKGAGGDIPMAFNCTPDIARFFSGFTGRPYPYAKYAQVVVEDFTFGGMENTSITILYRPVLHDEAAREDYRSESLVAHEMAHQWFGDLLTTKSWPHLWLNEGFATYMDALYHEHRFGRDEFHHLMEENAGAYFREASDRYRRPIVTGTYHDPDDLFDTHSYQKASWVLHMLRGKLGDKLFTMAIRHYMQRFAGRCVETGDFKTAVEEATGVPMDIFFNQWLHSPGHPEFEVSWRWEEGTKTAQILVVQKASGAKEKNLFIVDADVALLMSDGTAVNERLAIENGEHTFAIRCPSEPKCVLFDPDGWLLKEVKFEKRKEELLYQSRHAPTALARSEACRALGKMPSDADVVGGLAGALERDGFHGVRRAAARALGELLSPEAGAALIRGLEQTDSRVRAAVAEALGNYREEEVLRALAGHFDREKKDYPAAAVLVACGKTRLPGAYDTIVRGLQRKGHNEVIRRSVFDALAELRDPRGIDRAIAHIRYGEQTFVREAATRALGRLGDAIETRRREVREELVRLLRDREFRIRRAAADALGVLGDPAAIPALESTKENDLFRMVSRNARFAIRKIRDRSGEKGLKADFAKELQDLRDEARQMKSKVARLEALLDALGKGKTGQ